MTCMVANAGRGSSILRTEVTPTLAESQDQLTPTKNPETASFFSKFNKTPIFYMQPPLFYKNKQNIDVLKQVMRHMYMEYVTNQPDNITEQVERLNTIVLDYLVPKVYSEAIGYLKYLEDASRLVVPIELPVQPDRVYKQLELQPFM